MNTCARRLLPAAWRLQATRPLCSGAGCTQDRRTVLITGCDHGLGFSLALRAKHMGLHVVACCLDAEGAGARELRGAGLRVLPLDLCSHESIEHAAARAQEEEGSLWALVHNAAALTWGECCWQTHAQLERQMRVNAWGPMALTRALAPMLLRCARHSAAAAPPRVLLLSSACAHVPLPNLGPYAASKAALLAWAEALRREMRKYGVCVATLEPGDAPADTNMFAAQASHALDMRAAMTPFERELYGAEEDQGGFFWRVQRHVGDAFPCAHPPRDLRHGRLGPAHRAFARALQAERSPRAHTHARGGAALALLRALLHVLPAALGDALVRRLARMPAWP